MRLPTKWRPLTLLTVFGVQAGIILSATVLALMASLVSVAGGFLSVLPGMLAMGLGIGLSMTPSTEAITGLLPRERQGVASALMTRLASWAPPSAALLGAVLSAGYTSSITPQLHGVPTGTADTAREGVGNAVAAAHGAGPQAQPLVLAAQQSFVDGWQNAMWTGAALMAVLFVYGLARASQRATPRQRPGRG